MLNCRLAVDVVPFTPVGLLLVFGFAVGLRLLHAETVLERLLLLDFHSDDRGDFGNETLDGVQKQCAVFRELLEFLDVVFDVDVLDMENRFVLDLDLEVLDAVFHFFSNAFLRMR